MRRWAWALAALALGPGAAMAQDWATVEVCTVDEARIDDAVFDPPGRAALEKVAEGIENRRGRFWQITSPDGAVSHLWGTWHSSDTLILDLPEAVRDVIEAARMVAVEVDYVFKSREEYRNAQFLEGRFNEASDPFSFTPDDQSIAGLPAEISAWITERAIELNWTEDFELVLSTAGIAEMLLSDPCEDFSTGVLPLQDDYIQLLGRLAGAEIRGLEDPSEFLTDLTEDEATAEAIIAVYAAYLKPVTSNADRSTAFGIYREGRLGLMMAWDAAFLEQVLGPRAAEALALTDAYLIAKRNERFVERLADDLAEGGVVVAVGAGHLPGKDGLVTMLRAEGYEVTRVPLPGEAP